MIMSLMNKSFLNNGTIQFYVLTNVGYFDGTLYNQGLAELRLIMTLPLRS